MRQHHTTTLTHEGPMSKVPLPRTGALRPRLPSPPSGPRAGDSDEARRIPEDAPWKVLAEWAVPSEPGNERLAMRQVAAVIEAVHVPARRLERLKTAVAEATMNAMEHGNRFQSNVPVTIRVLSSAAALAVRISDQGGSHPRPAPIAPDLEAKLAGLQTPRGWGLFLIEHLVDELHVSSTDTEHTVELILYNQGATSASITGGPALTPGAHDRDLSA